MQWIRWSGIALVAIGGTILLYGMNEADSFSEQWNKFFSGQFSSGTMGYLIGGLVTLVIGFAMLLYRGSNRPA